MNILAIGAHPDDIEIGCAGTLIRLQYAGHKVICLCMTAANHIRFGEFLNACKVMKATPIHYLGEDTKLNCNSDLINTLEVYREKFKPGLVFTHFPNDTHQDHRNLSNAVLAAMRYIRNLLFYESLTSIDFNPTIFSDIKEVFYKEKMKVVQAHKSQLQRTNIRDLSLEKATNAMAIFRGLQGRVKYAEGFVPIRYFMGI